MYKVEVESIESKIKSIKELRKNHVITAFLGLSGLLLSVGLFSDVKPETLLLESVMFSISFVVYVFVFPLLGKIELLEQDIKNIKAAPNLGDEKHY